MVNTTDTKKTATFAEYVINKKSNNSVAVFKDGILCENTKAGLRDIAARAGFIYEDKWTTQQLGSKLVDFLQTNGMVNKKEEKQTKQKSSKKNKTTNWKDEYDRVIQGDDRFYGVIRNNKMGIADIEGNLLTPIKYEEVEFLDNYIKVGCDDRWGLIDINGKEVIPLKYDKILTAFSDGAAVVQLDDMMGFVGQNGEELISPCLERVCTNGGMSYWVLKDELWGIVGLDGKWLVKPKYDDYISISEEYDTKYAEGYTKVLLKNKEGILDALGKIVVPVEYDRIGVLESERGNLIFMANKKGEITTFQPSASDAERKINKANHTETEEEKSEQHSISERFAILAYWIANLDNHIQDDEIKTILKLSEVIQEFDDNEILAQLMIERLGTELHSINDIVLSVEKEFREIMFRALVMVATSDFHITNEKMDFLDALPQTWKLDADNCNAFIQSWIMNLTQRNPDKEFVIDEKNNLI